MRAWPLLVNIGCGNMKESRSERIHRIKKTVTQEKNVMELNLVAVTINQHLCETKFRKVLTEEYYILNDRVRVNHDGRIALNPA